MSTTYPASIDTTQSLPRAVDTLTPVSSVVVNRLRDTIVVIEAALGTNPGGNFGSVGARLMFLENNFANLTVISLAGDLGGTTQHPLVIGLQGNPVSSASPIVGQALTWNGIAWVPGSPVPPAEITSLGGPVPFYEIGQALVNPIFTATYSAPPTTAIFVDNQGNPPLNVLTAPPPSQPPGVFLYPESYLAADASDLPYSVVFTLTAGNLITSTATFTATWGQRVFYGVGTVADYQADPATFIKSLTSQILPLRAYNFTVNAGVGEVIFFAYASNLDVTLGGPATFYVDGFEGGFTAPSGFTPAFAPDTVSITNAFNVTETYNVFVSNQTDLGNTLVYVF